MKITTDAVKVLRDKTGVSIAQCKKALEEAGGDEAKALAILKKKSGEAAEKKSGRTLGAGIVSAYIHASGTIGAMVEVSCETDFVAKNEEFKKMAYDLAMHVAAVDPENNEELLSQPFIKDESLTVKDVIDRAVQKFGEKTEITRFVRLQV